MSAEKADKIDSRYRAMPFWAWNGELEEKELHRQIDIMKEMGFGGFFMHSRTGLSTEYLGEEWFRLINSCAVYASSVGMEAWIYDEDRWPSGSAGGFAAKKEKHRMRFISLYTDDSYLTTQEVERVLFRFAVKLDVNGRLVDYYKLKRNTSLKNGYTLNVFCEEKMKPSPNYNGYTYIDTMDINSTKAYIKLTHEKYKKYCGNLLGKEIKGVFTDEPHRGPLFNSFGIDNKNSRNMTPFTKKLFAYYRKRWGDDLSQKLPELFYKGAEEWSETSYRYVICLNDLFIDNFVKPYYSWCKKNNLLVTGHFLHEDALRMQTSMCGSLMRCYEYMDWPGIDILGETNACFWVPKQCASIARQLNKPMVLSELYGCTGWQMTFEQYKICTDWQIMFGVNMRCPHISWYTMKGQAKRDYPASILHQSAWYPHHTYLEDYFARLSQRLDEGEPVTDTLVINAIESMFGYVHKDWLHIFDYSDANIDRLEKLYEEQFFNLIGKHIDFDYADEDILARYGSVEKRGGKTYLKVGSAEYSQVLKGDFLHLRESTKILLDEFEREGGHIVGEVSKLDSSNCVTAPEKIAVSLKKTESGANVFLLNLDRESAVYGARVVLPDKYRDFYAVETNLSEDKVVGSFRPGEIVLDFEPGQEHFLTLTKSSPIIEYMPFYEKATMPSTMTYALSEPNVLVLDKAKYYINGELQNDGNAMPVLKIDRQLRDRYALVRRGGEMMQPWFEKIYNKNADDKLCDVKLQFTFSIKDMPQKNIKLALENFESAQVKLNGHVISGIVKNDWVDKCFDVIELDNANLLSGTNEITVEQAFCAKSDLESIYLLGSFGVNVPSEIIKLPERLFTYDITKQGLPYYSGAIKFFTGIKDKNVSIRFESINCSVLIAHGGEEKKYIAYAPYCADIALKNELVLECVFTRRNTFGPHHNVPYPDISYPPASFVTDGKNWTDEYVLETQGFRTELKHTTLTNINIEDKRVNIRQETG